VLYKPELDELPLDELELELELELEPELPLVVTGVRGWTIAPRPCPRATAACRRPASPLPPLPKPVVQPWINPGATPWRNRFMMSESMHPLNCAAPPHMATTATARSRRTHRALRTMTHSCVMPHQAADGIGGPPAETDVRHGAGRDTISAARYLSASPWHGITRAASNPSARRISDASARIRDH